MGRSVGPVTADRELAMEVPPDWLSGKVRVGAELDGAGEPPMVAPPGWEKDSLWAAGDCEEMSCLTSSRINCRNRSSGGSMPGVETCKGSWSEGLGWGDVVAVVVVLEGARAPRGRPRDRATGYGVVLCCLQYS